MKHSHNHIPLLILAIAVTAMAGSLYAYMFYATTASVARANSASDVVALEKADQSQEKSLMSVASTTAIDRARLASFFVPADSVVSFITALEALGPESGSAVSIASIASDSLSGKTSGTVGSAQAQINARGSWSSVMRALSLAERMPYAVSISNVRMDESGAMAGSKSRSWNLSLDIKALILQ
jgi:hypothetical protein